MFDPIDWYWRADDGRIFASARGAIVNDQDESYLAWLSPSEAPMRGPTPWPRDAAGEQTDSSLQEVLTPYGIWVDLVAYAADVRWRKEVGGIVIGGVPVATDDRSKMMIVGARVSAMADPQWSTIWHGADGNTYPVDAAAMVAISDAVQAHVNATFATFASVKSEIEAGEITMLAGIDNAFSVGDSDV